MAGSSLFFALIHSNNQIIASTWVPMTELFAAGFILGLAILLLKIYGFQLFPFWMELFFSEACLDLKSAE